MNTYGNPFAKIEEANQQANDSFTRMTDELCGRVIPRVTGKATALDRALAEMAETIELFNHPTIKYYDRPENLAADADAVGHAQDAQRLEQIRKMNGVKS
jgi:hypothetical protein